MKIKSVSINNKNSSNEVVINVSKPGYSEGNEKSTNGSIIKIKDTNYTANIRYQVFWSKNNSSLEQKSKVYDSTKSSRSTKTKKTNKSYMSRGSADLSK
jgi:hypothetical protein